MAKAPKIVTLPQSSLTFIPTQPGLADPYLKLGRAKMHLDTVDLLLKEFTGPKAYTVRRYDDLEQKRYCFECKLLDVPDEVCLAAGDAFYNARACLDQLVWSLSSLTVANPQTTQFPVFGYFPSAKRDIERFSTDRLREFPLRLSTKSNLFSHTTEGHPTEHTLCGD